MAKINFPNPAVQQTYTAGDITWTWNPTQQLWFSEGSGAVGGASVSVGENPPSGALQGDLWWNSGEDDGRLYVFYSDAGTSQWVETSPGFDGDYNNLINKPPLFGLANGSFEKNLLTWQTVGGVQEVTVPDTDGSAGDTGDGVAYSYTSQPTTVVTGSGNGSLTVSFVKQKGTEPLTRMVINNPGSGYAVGDTFSFVVPVTSTTVTGTVTEISTAQEDGWYPEPGTEYFVSATQAATYVGRPNFEAGVSFGIDREVLTDDQFASGSLFIAPPAGKAILNSYYTAGTINNLRCFSGNRTSIVQFDGSDAATAQEACKLILGSNGNANLTSLTGEVSLISNNAEVLKANNSGQLQSLQVYNQTNSSSNNYVRLNNNGVFQRSTSSKRYKDNIRDLTLTNAEALTIIDGLQPRLWEDYSTGETVAGLVAEEVFATAGEHFVSFTTWAQERDVVTGQDADGEDIVETQTFYPFVGNGETPVTKDGGALTDTSEVVDGLNDRALILALLKAVQELKDRVEALETP